MSLKQRWEDTLADVAEICKECGRDPKEVKVLAVSKTVDAPVIKEALECGMRDFGENRTVPFNEKHDLYPQANWHFIGSLQSNKASKVVGKAALIHSLDRESLLHALQKSASAINCVQDVLIEVSISGEESKGGISPDDLPAFLEEFEQCPNLRCKGLMTMAPRGNEDVAYETFDGLQKLAKHLNKLYLSHDNISFDELSMGMSEDYRQAIFCGSTIVRIGRRIFSEDFSA